MKQFYTKLPALGIFPDSNFNPASAPGVRTTGFWYKTTSPQNEVDEGISSHITTLRTFHDNFGNGNDISQATGANQSLFLPADRTHGVYLYLPGIAGNYASTPDSPALSITGVIDIRIGLIMKDYTPSAGMSFVAKYSLGGQYSYRFGINSDGTLYFIWSTDGTATTTATSTVTNGITNNTFKVFRVAATLDGGGNGIITFYTGDLMAGPWTQLGAIVATGAPFTIYNSLAIVEVGTIEAGTGRAFEGNIYRVNIYNSVGALVMNFNPNDGGQYVNSWASLDTGEIWTVRIPTTAGYKSQVVQLPVTQFDGVNDLLTGLITGMTQPFTVYMLVKQYSWTSGSVWMDGANDTTLQIEQNLTTPNIRQNAGATGDENGNIYVNEFGIVTAIFDGVDSELKINLATTITSDAGNSANPDGYTLGAFPNGTFAGNIGVIEIIGYGDHHDETIQTLVRQDIALRNGYTM